MPVLENVNIALAEVLEVRGKPLEEDELWALLGQSIPAIEDLFLTGRAHKNGVPEYTITPCTLQCTAMGRIVICAATEDESQISLYEAPEVKSFKTTEEDNGKLEKYFIYSLGKTIWFAANYDQNASENNFLQNSELKSASPILSNLVVAMTESDVDKRISFPDFVRACLNNVPQFTNQVPIRKIIITLHEEVLGSLPEGEILRQVEKNVSNESKDFEFDELNSQVDENYSTSKRQSRVFTPNPNSTEFVYGHRLEYSFKDNLLSIEPELVAPRNTSPRERWKNAFTKVNERRRRDLLITRATRNSSNDSSRWDNYKAKESIEKVCEELTERRKMLELLRMNINLAPSVNVDLISNANIAKGIKPKTLAELVMMLKKPKLVRGSSSSSLGSNGSIRSAMAAVARTSTPSSSTHNSTPEKTSHKSTGGSTSLLKNVVTANLKKRANPSYYSTVDSELFSSNCTQYSWNPTAYTYYGPEFVIRSTMSPIKMRLSSPSQDRTNSISQFKATVILLSGQQLVVTSNASVSGRRLFHSVAHQIALPEPNLFGLATKKGDEYLFIDTKQKLNKLKLSNPNTELVTLYLRVKYFLPDINFLSIQPLKHLYYLQLRRNILERKTFCSYEKGISLAGLALQAEFGDYNPKRFGGGDYFLLEHYLPDCAIRVCDREDTKSQIFQSHLENAGKTCEEAEDEYIRAVMDLPEYGYHFYTVLQDKNDSSSEVWVSISAWGVDVFEDQNEQRSMCQSYSWSNIRQISFSKRYFTLVPKSQSLTGKPVKYMFFIGDYTKSCCLFGMAVGHHRFFVKQKIEKSLSVNSSLEELDLIPFSSITNNENASEDEDIEYKINSDSINDYQENPKSWISNFTNKYFEGVRNSSFGTPKKKFVHKLTKSHSVSEKEPIDSIRKEFGISIKSPLPPLSSFHSSLKRLPVDEPPTDYNENSRHYDDSYEVLLLRSDLENGLGLTLTCGCDETTLLRGTFIESVLPDGPCHGKVNQGDRLIALNGERVEEKNYLEVVDIIGEVTGDVLLTLVPAVSKKKLSLELKFEMPSRLEDNEGANPKTKELEDCFFNGNSKYELDDNRNSSTLDAYRSLDKNDNQIKTNNHFSSAVITSPPVPARRRRKNTYKSSLSSSGGEGENSAATTTTDGNSVGGIPTTALNSSRNGSGEGNVEPLTSASDAPLQRRADDNWETTSTVPTTNEITFGEMGTLKDSAVADVKRRRTSRDERQEEEEEASRDRQLAEDFSSVYEVTLRKINESFGFRVAERYQFVDGFRRGIFVHSLIPRGSAEFDGRIKPGDQLIKINGVSTEELSYKEGVALLKRSPDTGTLCFLRINQFSTSDSDINADCLHEEDSRNMISKWGRRGSRSSLASQTNSGCSSPTTTVKNITSPIYARSISQVILPTVEELRALAEKDDKYYQEEIETLNINRDSYDSKSTHEMGYVDISSLAGESPSVNGTNGVVINGNVNKERSSPVANGGSLRACPDNSAATDFSKELLGIVPENYSLSSYDSVFNSDNGATPAVNDLLDDRPNSRCSVTGSAIKYLANRVGGDDRVDKGLEREISLDYTGTSTGQLSPNDGEPKPLPRKKKNKCGFIEKPEDVLKFTNETNCFQVTIRKSSRGLGLAIFGGVDMSRLGPICQLIRIRKLYPLQPAVACGELNVGDVILEVNGLNTIGLTNTEALETLRVASTDVVLKIFRPDPSLMPPVTFFIQDLSPASSAMISPTGSATNTLKRPSTLNCGSNTRNTYITTTLTKQEGTLGFSVFRYEKCGDDDNHSTGIYVKALIREPAISNGQIQAGDRILRVNEEEVSHLSRSEAVTLLRNSGDSVTLKLYRFCEPLSPRSSEDVPSHSKPLRIEARELLSDKARRKSDGNSSSPRRVRDRTLKRESTSSSSSSEFKNSHDVPVTLPDSIEESPVTPDEILSPTLPLSDERRTDADAESDDSEMDLSGGLNRNSRPKSLDLLCINEKKQNSVRSEVEELEDGNQLFHRQASVVVPNSNENNNEKRQIDENGEGLLKWRGATLLSTEENVARLNLSLSTLSSGCQSPLSDQSRNGSNGELNSPPAPPRRLTSLQSWDSTPEETEEFLSSGQKLRKLYVQLDRGWQSRLGFSLGDQLPSDTNRVSPQVSSPVVTAVHSGSLAHKDGRIAVGDRLIEVNGESLLDKTSAEVIDLLRKTRGKVHLVLLRVSNDNKEPLI